MQVLAWNLSDATGFKIIKTLLPFVYKVEQMKTYFYIICFNRKLKITEKEPF